MIVKSFCVERPVYESLRAILSAQGRSISEEVNELLKRRLAELKGGEQPSNGAQNYEALKREHVQLMEESIRLTRLLQKTGEYDALIEMAENLGLNTETLEKAEEVAAKLLQTWNGPKAPAHTLITLLETIQKRKQIEKQLEKIRTKRGNC
ncbi:MAG: hypothetical protein QXQ50_05300 [Candidatus Bathyarchaeia archaeon]|nr:hypothetical protein [Candidatus Bathyarchaeota archaeon]